MPCGGIDRDELARLLVGSAEIAERLGLTQAETVHSWVRRHPDFPRPLVRLRIGFVWWWPDVEQWARATGRIWP